MVSSANNIGIIEVVKGVKARIVRRTGPRISDKVLFEAISVEPLTLEDIAVIQTNLGYSPSGYGGPDIANRNNESIEGYITSWTCSASCD